MSGEAATGSGTSSPVSLLDVGESSVAGAEEGSAVGEPLTFASSRMAEDRGADGLTEYERRRQENIRRNQEMLASLQINNVTARAVAPDMKAVVKKKSKPRESRPRPPRRPLRPALPSRQSRRIRGLNIAAALEADAAMVAAAAQADAVGTNIADIEPEVMLTEASEYFAKRDITPLVVVDSTFRAWVNPEVCQRNQIPPSYEECVSEGAMMPPSSADSRGWSKARHWAARMMRRNPNSYFYRHCEPGVAQWVGDWTQEEHDLFIKLAKEHGCGDKWGLFASYIPHRVGYQCSNYYRDTILPRGLIIDPCYRISKDGRAVFVGARFKHPIVE